MFPTFHAIFKRLSASNVMSTWRAVPWWHWNTKQSVQTALLRLISVAQTQSLELAPLVSRLALEHRTLTRVRLNRLAQRLSTGTSLVDALEQTPHLIGDSELLEMRFAMQTGLLKSELPKIIERNAGAGENVQNARGKSLSYYVGIAFISLCSLFFLLTFIFPTYQKIFEEMEIENAPSFEWLLKFGDFIISYSLPFLCGLVVIVCIVFGAFPYHWFQRTFASFFFHTTAEKRSAQLLRLLSSAIDAGRPLTGSISTLARYHFDRIVRTKLLFVRNEIELGTNVWESFENANLLTSSECRALSQSTSSVTRSWLLGKIAEGKEQIVRYRIDFFTSLIHPIVIVSLGLFVLWLALATFGTLTTLVNGINQ